MVYLWNNHRVLAHRSQQSKRRSVAASSGSPGTGLWHCLLLRLAGQVQKNIMLVDAWRNWWICLEKELIVDIVGGKTQELKSFLGEGPNCRQIWKLYNMCFLIFICLIVLKVSKKMQPMPIWVDALLACHGILSSIRLGRVSSSSGAVPSCFWSCQVNAGKSGTVTDMSKLEVPRARRAWVLHLGISVRPR